MRSMPRRHDFYEKLKSVLQNRGLIQSAVDLWDFYKKKFIIILYCVDNFLLPTQNRELSDDLSVSFDEDFIWTNEGEADGCLSVEIKITDDLLTLK